MFSFLQGGESGLTTRFLLSLGVSHFLETISSDALQTYGQTYGTPGASAKSSLRLYLPTLELGQQPYPGKDLRHGGRQGEAVGNIMIPSCPKLELEPPPLQ
jgi:hypothetical protein